MLAELARAGQSSHAGSGRGGRAGAWEEWLRLGLGIKSGSDVKSHISHPEVYRHYPKVRVGAKSLYKGSDTIQFLFKGTPLAKGGSTALRTDTGRSLPCAAGHREGQ